MKRALLPVLALVLSACGEKHVEAPPPTQPVAPTALVPKICGKAKPGVYAAKPFTNKTKSAVDLGGTDDLVMTALTESGCFTVAERDKVEVLLEEMKRCAPESADSAYFACDSFAKKGHLFGITHFVFGDLVLYEPKIKGTELGVKIPGLGGIEGGVSYSAISVNVRLVSVETGKVVTSKIVNAVVRDEQGGFEVSGGQGLALKAAAYQRTPAGTALKDMIAGAVRHFSEAGPGA